MSSALSPTHTAFPGPLGTTKQGALIRCGIPMPGSCGVGTNTPQKGCVYLWVIFHPQEEVVLQPFLAVLARAVEVVLLLQLLLALFADVKEVDVGHGQLFSF